jgi:hypothetical protein
MPLGQQSWSIAKSSRMKGVPGSSVTDGGDL